MHFWKLGVLGKVGLAALLAVAAAETARAQGPAQTADGAVAAELQVLGRAAGTVFVGQITGIEHKKGVVEVRFRVEQGVRGAVGATYTLREWGGLWAPGVSRYAVGQRVLAFLHGASASGFGSPVHGAEGLVPVEVQGVGSPALLDIRRIAASVERTPGTPLPTEADGAILLPSALGLLTQGGAGSGELQRVALRAPKRQDRLGEGQLQSGISASFGGRPVFSPVAPVVGSSDAHR